MSNENNGTVNKVNRKRMIPFTLENVADLGLGDEVVIALEPVVSVLANVGRVVTGFNGTDVVDHSKKRIPEEEEPENWVPSLGKRMIFFFFFFFFFCRGGGSIF